ncbi:MAG: adenylyl-sulfate kinase [Nitrospirota bacterium]
MGGFAVWITGIPGSGKTAIAKVLSEKVPGLFHLQLDRMRKMVTPEPAYSDAEREMVYRCLINHAVVLTELGHNVVIDATGHRRLWRDIAREKIRRFVEIYLRCPVDVCIEREQRRLDDVTPKDVYKKARSGEPVPGINVPYEEPLNPEIIIDSDTISVEEAAEKIRQWISEKWVT